MHGCVTALILRVGIRLFIVEDTEGVLAGVLAQAFLCSSELRAADFLLCSCRLVPAVGAVKQKGDGGQDDKYDDNVKD